MIHRRLGLLSSMIPICLARTRTAQGAQSVKYYLGLVAGHKGTAGRRFPSSADLTPAASLLQEFFVGGAGGNCPVQLSPGQALCAVGLDLFRPAYRSLFWCSRLRLYIDAARFLLMETAPVN